MIILYFILLVLLVVTIFDSAVGLVFVFVFAQNNANTVGFDTSDILEGILIIADIAGVAIVGLVIVTVYYQKRERKFDGMMEVFKLLNGNEQRESRLKLFEAYHM
jgi:heme/copper-type cytochrome/quinol oxidase subunit 2